jgi:tRNA-2-methylthio-N6-dimethylallyladenosine synthase
MPKFFIKTYGCQMNERDSDQVAHSLLERGYEAVAHERDADVVLLNTCSVRDMADQKALGKMGMMRHLANKRPEMVFGFLGCMAQARGDSLFSGMPHLDLVVGTQKFHRVADYVEEIVDKKRSRRMDDPRYSISDTAEEPAHRLRSRAAGRRAAGDGVRLDHAGVQHALHVLHRAAHAGRGAEPLDR